MNQTRGPPILLSKASGLVNVLVILFFTQFHLSCEVLATDGSWESSRMMFVGRSLLSVGFRILLGMTGLLVYLRLAICFKCQTSLGFFFLSFI